MFKIGDFSKISRVPVKTLRYYDELGLLKPLSVDAFTGYRYYATQQLARLNRILALKDLGLSLEQIALLLDHDLPAGQIRGMLRRKQAEISQRVQEEQQRLERVEARLRLIEIEGKMPAYEITIKKIPPLRVAALRGTIPTYPEQGPLWTELESELRRQGVQPTGPCLTRYLDAEYRERDIDAEVCEPVGSGAVSHGRVQVYDLPAEEMASLVHHGPFNTLNQAYQALFKWLEQNNYRICGPEREIYLHTGSGPTRQDDPSYVTEIQFPVQKAS